MQGINWYVDVFNPEIEQAKKVQDGLIAMIVVVAIFLSGMHELARHESAVSFVSNCFAYT